MALPFLDSGSRKKHDQMLAVDLGFRVTKAALLARRGTGFALSGYALLDAPIFEKALSAELLAEHLKQLHKLLPTKNRLVTLTLGINDALVRPLELPPIPENEIRPVLRNNSKVYLQQDLSGHVFDCQLLSPPLSQSSTKPEAGMSARQKLLVTSAKKELIDTLTEGIRTAGLIPACICPGIVGPVNAFEMAFPDVFRAEAVALVDIGFKNSSICLLQQGELVLSRTVATGGDKLTSVVSESMNISYAEAEGIKIGMPQEVEPALETVLTPLGRELRASIDFFEHQHDKVISQIFISGGSIRSDVILQHLQTELLVECKRWNPTSFLKLELPAQQAAQLEEIAPRLSVAVGAALAAL
jgi:type IV pilus assembly protein PilM